MKLWWRGVLQLRLASRRHLLGGVGKDVQLLRHVGPSECKIPELLLVASQRRRVSRSKPAGGQVFDPVWPSFGGTCEVLHDLVREKSTGCVSQVEIISNEAEILTASCSLDIRVRVTKRNPVDLSELPWGIGGTGDTNTCSILFQLNIGFWLGKASAGRFDRPKHSKPLRLLRTVMMG